jgi:hypothetical protein
MATASRSGVMNFEPYGGSSGRAKRRHCSVRLTVAKMAHNFASLVEQELGMVIALM